MAEPSGKALRIDESKRHDLGELQRRACWRSVIAPGPFQKTATSPFEPRLTGTLGNTSLPANGAGFQIHSAIHKRRPDVAAAAHTHSPYGLSWSPFGRPLEMLTQDAAYLYGDAQGVYDVRLPGFDCKLESGH